MTVPLVFAQSPLHLAHLSVGEQITVALVMPVLAVVALGWVWLVFETPDTRHLILHVFHRQRFCPRCAHASTVLAYRRGIARLLRRRFRAQSRAAESKTAAPADHYCAFDLAAPAKTLFPAAVPGIALQGAPT